MHWTQVSCISPKTQGQGSLTPRLLDHIATYRLQRDLILGAELREQGDGQTRVIGLASERIPLGENFDRSVVGLALVREAHLRPQSHVVIQVGKLPMRGKNVMADLMTGTVVRAAIAGWESVEVQPVTLARLAVRWLARRWSA